MSHRKGWHVASYDTVAICYVVIVGPVLVSGNEVMKTERISIDESNVSAAILRLPSCKSVAVFRTY